MYMLSDKDIPVEKREPLVYLFVLCHNSKKWLKKCLDTLLNTDYTRYKVHIIDNNSSDDSVEFVKDNYPSVSIIQNKRNLGWCKGNNVGIEISRNIADYTLFLNSDTSFEKTDWLKELVEFAECNHEYGIYGCVQYDYNSSDFLNINTWTKYILTNGNRDIFYSWNKKMSNIVKNKPAYLESVLSRRKHIDCYFVQGAAMMVKNELLNEIGGFDPLYFIFQDEVDFSRRARYKGYKTALVCNSRIKHVGSGDNSSTKKNMKRRNFYYTRNKYIFLLTDVSRNWDEILEISQQFFRNDLKDALKTKQDVSSVFQLVSILFSILIKSPSIFKKRMLEKRMKQTF